MGDCRKQHYYGSYGLVRGYGPLCQTLREADDSVYDDSRAQRKNGGSSDRCVVIVSKGSGLCWWWEEADVDDSDLIPVRTVSGDQAKYVLEVIGPTEMAGFG